MLVNYRGEITNVWVGKLPPEAEQEVFKAAGL
jgi:hypothetical protein